LSAGTRRKYRETLTLLGLPVVGGKCFRTTFAHPETFGHDDGSWVTRNWYDG
jgi:hypothetical protein